MKRLSGKSATSTAFAVISLAAALGGILGVQSVLEMPGSRERLIDLIAPGSGGDLSPIRTVRDDVIWTDSPTRIRTAANAPVRPPPADLRDVTGSIPPPPGSVRRTEFGADVGGSGNIRDIRALWSDIQASLEARGAAVRPLLVFRDDGTSQQLRLVVGPVSDAAEVARLCALMPTVVRSCGVSPYVGQGLPPK